MAPHLTHQRLHTTLLPLPGEGLYSEKDLEAAIERTEVIDFHQVRRPGTGWHGWRQQWRGPAERAC